MKFLVVHLSDMHIENTRSIDTIVVDKIMQTISNDAIDISHILVLITGDIANSGREDEYSCALDVINNIICSFTDKKINICICPGNHDKNLIKNESTHDIIVDNILHNSNITQENANFINEYFSHYNDFVEIIESENSTPIKNNNFIREYAFKFGNININIDSFNTALCSKRSCKHASLYIPMEKIPSKRTNISICIMHNTENWIKLDDRKEYRDKITSTYDFVFTGHEHSSYAYRVENSAESSVIMVEGGAIRPHGNTGKIEFNTVAIDCSSKNAIIKRYELNRDPVFFKQADCADFEYGGKSSYLSVCGVPTKVNPSFIAEMQDSGAPFRHPTKRDLFLDDLFVYPEIQKFAYAKNKGNFKQKILSMEDLNIYKGRFIFVGAEKSGKSHCCKNIFLNSMRNNQLPVLVKITNKSNIYNTEDFEKEIIRSAKTAYVGLDIDAFKQAPAADKIIIIDDYHTLKISNAKKYKILGEISERYRNICIFSDESTQFDTLIYAKENGKNIHDAFELYTLIPFGNKKRDELIRLWHLNDLPYDEDPVAAEHSIEASRSVLQAIVKNGFVPAYPFFLYTALSSFSMPKTDARIEESTYGYFFTTLLSIAVEKISRRPDENDLYFNYLTEFAFYLFSHNVSFITIDEYLSFHKWYIYEFSLSTPYSDMLDKLKLAKLIQERDDIVFFRYKYFYFYFLAKYLTSCISEKKTKDIIDKFCNSLHNETSSNVLMFLIHLSKDQSIINALISKAENTLKDYEEVDLRSGIDFIDNLINELPEITYDTSADHASEKVKILEAADRMDSIPNSKEYSGDNITPIVENEVPNDDVNEFDANAMGDAFKTIEIIGQIIRNYHGSLRTSLKDSLCKEAYSLSLRGISAFFSMLTVDREGLLEELAKILENIAPELKEKRETAARKFLFGIASIVAYAFIMKGASELGSSHLSVTFARIFEKYNGADNLAVSLIDIAIKLDHRNSSPTEEVKRLAKKCSNNNVGYIILQWLTYRHLRMYPLPIDVRQKLCAATNITFSASLAGAAPNHIGS